MCIHGGGAFGCLSDSAFVSERSGSLLSPPPSGDLASVSPCCGMWLVHSLASWHPGVYVVVCGSALLETRGALASPSFWPSGG